MCYSCFKEFSLTNYLINLRHFNKLSETGLPRVIPVFLAQGGFLFLVLMKRVIDLETYQ